jgi:hypothetical protein
MRKASFIICLLGLLSFILTRSTITNPNHSGPFVVTTWDALGYYLYLPAGIIYKDYKKLAFYPEIEKKYKLQGDRFYQVSLLENGNYACKYLGGIAILQWPFFISAHYLSEYFGYPRDGFSFPYQLAMVIGVMFYCFLALLLFRKILLKYFSDTIVFWVLFGLIFGTNFIQYVSVDAAQTHGYIFPLYVLILWLTIKWHETPKWFYALGIGFVIGLATISRPTEAIMLFIPLLWGVENKISSTQKWRLVRENLFHVYAAIIGGIIGILPQLIYWKHVSGSWIYDVGSKWYFLNPWFRVIFGFQKGWFIYTPITIFFVLGFFYIKRYTFRYSVLVFCILNLWIITAWSDWTYGGSFSARALVQSYPIFSLSFAAFLTSFWQKKWFRLSMPILIVYFSIVNLFQIWQYNKGIIDCGANNLKYYSQVYLNSSPSPFQYSLLDNDDFISDETNFEKIELGNSLEFKFKNLDENNFMKYQASFKLEENTGGYFKADIYDYNNQLLKSDSTRLRAPNIKICQKVDIGFYQSIPISKDSLWVKLYFPNGITPISLKSEKLIAK